MKSNTYKGRNVINTIYLCASKKDMDRKPKKVQAELDPRTFLRLMFWARKKGYRGLASYVSEHLYNLHENLSKLGELPKDNEIESE